MKRLFAITFASIIGSIFLIALVGTTVELTSKVVLKSDITWSPLNPARGDKSPQAGALWGERTGSGPSGFLVKFADGFESPPHIHNVTYRGVVISGLVHNDDPAAKNMWLPAGSFWTQPAREAHVTAAKGQENIAYIEIDSGPYLVKPESEAFDNGERPVNVDKSNLVWLNASDIQWIDHDGIEIAFLWGSPHYGKLNGSLVKIPAGTSSRIVSNGSVFHGIIIQGRPHYNNSTLEAGSYFGSESTSGYVITSDTKEESIIYIRTNGKLEITQID